MVWNPFKSKMDACVGIDIGTSSVKIVELKASNKGGMLANYGEVSLQDVKPEFFRQNLGEMENQEIAGIIKKILETAKIHTKKAVISLPDYYSFFTTFTLPRMSREEMEEAVKYEAPVRIPLPISKVTLDWQVVKGQEIGKNGKEETIKILLVAVPTEIITKYQEIASLAKLNLQALEAEVFGMVRTLVKEDQTLMVVDMGAETTTCSIVDKKILKVSYSFDMGGKKMTETLAESLGKSEKEAEDLKKSKGILGEENIRNALLPVLDSVLDELKRADSNYVQEGRQKVQKIVLVGGCAIMPGLKDYFESNLRLPVEIGNSFSDIVTPPELSDTLRKMAPFYATAVGMALRGIKNK